jgi:hydrogenase maturation protease
MKTLVIGLGNPILTDDGVGVKVAEQIAIHLSQISHTNITVTEASVGGLRLMELMNGYSKVIIIDALIQKDNNRPGRFHRLDLDDLRMISPTQHSASAHDTTLTTALDAGKLLGLSLPEEVIIFAIEVENIMDFNDQATPTVSHAIPQVVNAVLEELDLETNIEYKQNEKFN